MGEKTPQQRDYEREILGKLRQIEASVARNISAEKRELVETRYYKEFVLNSRKGPVVLSNVYITIEKNQEGKLSYHFRWMNNEMTLIEEKIEVIDGKMFVIPEAEEDFRNINIDIETAIEENDNEKGRLRGISKQATQEQSKKLLSDEKKEKQGNEKAKTEQIEQDIAAQQPGKEVKIGKHREIKDDKIADRMPNVFEKGKQYEVAQIEPTGQAIILEKDENGKYQINQQVKIGIPNVKQVYSMDQNGKVNIEERPEQLMDVEGEPTQQISLTIDEEWGELDIQTVRVTPCQSRIGRAVEMENEGPEGQERKKITDTFEREGERELSDEIAHKISELKNTYGVTEIKLEKVIDLDIESVIEAEAQKAKVSKESFKEYVTKSEGKTLEEKISNAHEEIQQEYRGGNTRPR